MAKRWQQLWQFGKTRQSVAKRAKKHPYKLLLINCIQFIILLTFKVWQNVAKSTLHCYYFNQLYVN